MKMLFTLLICLLLYWHTHASICLATDSNAKKIDSNKVALQIVQMHQLKNNPRYTEAIHFGPAPHLWFIIPLFIVSFYGLLVHLLYKFAPNTSGFTSFIEDLPLFNIIEKFIKYLWIIMGINLGIIVLCERYFEQLKNRFRKGKKTIRVFVFAYAAIAVSLLFTFIFNIM
jgi:hypothetical protein